MVDTVKKSGTKNVDEKETMSEQEAIVFIKNATEQSRNVMADLMLLMPRVFKEQSQRLGEYYSNLENCKKEIQSCEVAIKALDTLEKIKEIIREEEIYPVSNSLIEPHPNEQDYNKVHADKFKRIWKVISDAEK